VGHFTTASWRYWEKVLNDDFPQPPVPAENVAEPIPVIARVV
jgi:hypothetical protein